MILARMGGRDRAMEMAATYGILLLRQRPEKRGAEGRAAADGVVEQEVRNHDIKQVSRRGAEDAKIRSIMSSFGSEH